MEVANPEWRWRVNNRPFTLIDVENGMFNLSLHTILTPPCFSFFWGLVQTANRLKPRFKNPFNLTVAQAIAAGGGNSRQSIHQKQSQLNKIRVDGGRLIKIRAGSRSKYVCASYKINYKLLIPQNVMIPEFKADLSKILDTPLDTVLTHPLTQSGHSHDLPKIREEKRREESPSSVSNIVSKVMQEIGHSSEGGGNSSSEKERARTDGKEVEELQDIIMAAFHPQITAAPPYPACNSAIHEHGFGILKAAVNEVAGNALNDPTPRSALNYVIGCAKRIKSGNVDYAQRNRIIMELEDLKADILKAEAETDLTKFEGVFVPTATGEVAVNTQEEFLEAKHGEMNRFKSMLGGG